MKLAIAGKGGSGKSTISGALALLQARRGGRVLALDADPDANLASALGVPLVAALMVFFFVAKSVGLTVLGCFVGTAVLRRWVRHPMPISLEVFVGILVLLAARFLPFLGDTLWTLISLTALGACIATISVSADPARAET